jgi:predicted component of type VI protein secretion system
MSANTFKDDATIRAWVWQGPAGQTVNFAIELDAEPLLRGSDVEREIARHVERFEKSLRRIITPPDAAPRPSHRRREQES